MKKTAILLALVLVLCAGCKANNENNGKEVQPTATATVAPTDNSVTGDGGETNTVTETEEDTFDTGEDGKNTSAPSQGSNQTPFATAVPKVTENPENTATSVPQPTQTPEPTDDGIIHLPEI